MPPRDAVHGVIRMPLHRERLIVRWARRQGPAASFGNKVAALASAAALGAMLALLSIPVMALLGIHGG